MSQPPQPGEPEGQVPGPGAPQGQPYQQQPYPQPYPQQQGWYGVPQQPPQPPPSNKTALWVGLGVLGLVVVVVVAITGFVAPGFFLSDSKSTGAVASSAPSSAPTSSGQETTTTQSPVRIPTDRAPVPKRSTPLADPTECAYPADTGGGEVPKKATPPTAGPTPASGTAAVTLKTTAGDIGLTLDRALAPCTVANFLSLAHQGYYDGTPCHRLATSGLQMLQCGDPAGTGMGGPGYTIPDEVFPEIKYGRGILAMAKTQAPNSGGSQFFMVFGDAELPPDYTVFGTISDAGLQVLDKVARGGLDESQGAGDGSGPPRIPVKFQSVAIG
ncbi:peptidylprolyl isomerase [Amycolatopsis azurea]|uniref:Peptidyl-prolyl cis-trans isomerase n=1 Tax=Amycolatopsis azurea DSM 43854 TaxID=1238180 RepID=M2Q8Q2_9PSEU|nr:peptidylprolyl isomerase [Amycolatopsis azurea]EMD28365.1 Peptidyl-prolyl cis-trans isomerase [Amycolatopsis azurea DSM 43854]OOC06584.1 peptidyl-prolyl cis-trans isomerase [Amycolatopsis azurea DSM 43854]